MEAGTGRARSALVWVSVATVLVAVVGVVYLRPNLAVRPAAVATARPLPPDAHRLANFSFGDARHGEVTMARFASQATFVTSDGGRTWTPAGPMTYLSARLVIRWAVGPAGTDGISDDGGTTWRHLSQPDPAVPPLTEPVFADAAHGWWLAQPFAAERGITSLWRTGDGGATWQRLPGTGIPAGDQPVEWAFLDPVHGVLEVRAGLGAPALLLTDDGGVTWQPSLPLTSPDPGAVPARLRILVRDRTLLAWFVTLPAGGDPMTAVPRPYVLASGDAGRTWGPPFPGPSLQSSDAVSPVVDGEGRLLLLDGRRLWVSPDGGTTWTARAIQAPAGLLPIGPLVAGAALLAPAATTPTGAFPVYDALLRSTDGGVHWERVPLP